MIETLKQGLLITAIGMTIVFAMILVLWGIMALLVKLTNRPENEETAEEVGTSLAETEPAALTTQGDASELAAAIAVHHIEFGSFISASFIVIPQIGDLAAVG